MISCEIILSNINWLWLSLYRVLQICQVWLVTLTVHRRHKLKSSQLQATFQNILDVPLKKKCLNYVMRSVKIWINCFVHCYFFFVKYYFARLFERIKLSYVYSITYIDAILKINFSNFIANWMKIQNRNHILADVTKLNRF